jgi:hypothetical protein
MIRSMTQTLALISGLAVATAVVARPVLQPQPPEPPAKTLKGDPDRPLGQAGRADGAASSTFSFVQSDGTDTIKVKVVDGEVSAEVNGKVIPKDRIRQSNGKIEILDEKGNVEHTVNVQIGGFSEPMKVLRPRAPREQPGFRVERRGTLTVPQGQVRAVEAPKVMLGITMSTADATTLDRLGAKSESGVFVDSVIDGLPASRAGLEVNDLITAADGKGDLTEQGLREILSGKKPGDTVALKVFRKGEARDISVKLEAFDAEKLGRAGRDVIVEGMPEGWNPVEGEPFPGFIFGGGFDHDKIKESIEEALKHLKENGKDWEKVKAEVTDQLQEVLKQFEAHQDEFKGLMDGFRQNLGNHPRIRLFNNKGLIAPPPAPAAPEAPEAAPAPGRQLDRIADQLERLNRRLDDLEKRLNEKK